MNPLFVNPSSLNFNLQTNSQCRHAGLMNYDMGARFYDDIPETPLSFTISPTGNPNQMKLSWSSPNQTVHGNPLDTLQSIRIWRNDFLLAELPADSTVFFDALPRPDFYRYQICAVDTSGQMGRTLYSVEQWIGGAMTGFLIWELDPTPITSTALQTAMQELGISDNEIYISHTASRYPLESTVQAVFVCLGIYSNNHVLTNEEGQKLKNYLDSSGNVYIEGGDTWYYDPQTPVHPYFEINPISDGGNDLFYVSGEPGTPFENMLFAYSGENAWIDQIEPTALSQRIFFNVSTIHGTAVAYNAGSYRTIGASFELGGLVDNTPPSIKKEAIRLILQFFGILPTGIESGEQTALLPDQFILRQNYPNPFNSSTVVQFGLPETGEVLFEIYNIAGQKIYREQLGHQAPGWHKIYWNGVNSVSMPVASGLYFYRVSFRNLAGKEFIQTGKMHLIK